MSAFFIGLAGLVLRHRRRVRLAMDAAGACRAPRSASSASAMLGQSAAVFGGAVAAAAFGWQAVFHGVGVAAAGLGDRVRAVRAEQSRARARPAGVGAMIRVLRREPVAWALGAFYFLTFGGFVAFSIYLPTLLRDAVRPGAGRRGFPRRRLRGAGHADAAAGRLARRIALAARRCCRGCSAASAGFSLLLVWPSMVPFTVGALGCAALLGLGNGAVFKLVPSTSRATPARSRAWSARSAAWAASFRRCCSACSATRSACCGPGFVLLSADGAGPARRQSARCFSRADVAWRAALPLAARAGRRSRARRRLGHAA